FLQDDNSQVVEYEDKNQNTQFLGELDSFDTQNLKPKLISDNIPNLLTSESSIVEKTNNITLSNKNINQNATESDNNIILESSSITEDNSETKIDSLFLQDDNSQVVEYEDKNQNTQFLGELDSFDIQNRKAELISDNTSNLLTSESSIVEQTNNITSPTVEEPSTLVNDFSNNQNNNNRDSINYDSNFPIPDTTKQAEIPLDNIISTSNSQSQPITSTTSGTQTTQFISVENQDNQSNLYPDIVNSDIQKKYFLESQTLNESSNNQELSENTFIASPILKEPATLINDSSNHQDNDNQDSIQTGISLDNIISPSNNQFNISKTNSNQQFSNLPRSQSITTSTNEAQNNQFIPDLTQSEKLPILQEESTESQFTDVKNLEVKQISDDFEQLENITQEIFQSQEKAKISDITDNDELIEPKLRDVNTELSIPKPTDIVSSEIEQTNYISRKQYSPSYSPDVDNIIQTIPNVESPEGKKDETILPIESTSEINTKISNVLNHEDFPENLLESSSETEIPLTNPDLSVEQNKPDIQKIDTTEQESENKSDINHKSNHKFNHKFNNILDKKQIDKKQTIQGYATGGKVIESKVESNEQIAPSDTVPAMLSPGEFVVNAKDTQQNIDVLQHINSGKKAEEIIQPSLEKSILPETPNTVLQKKASQVISSPESNLLTSSPLGLEVGEQRLSLLNSSDSKQSENINHKITPSSTNNYSSSTLIFRKQSNHHTTNEVPSQWSNIEELLNSESSESDDFTTLFDFGAEETDSYNSGFSHISQTSSNSPRIAPKRIPEVKNFNKNREVTPSDIARDIEPISETIQNPSFTNEADKTKNEQQDTQDLEVLAHEIYLRLRQRLEIEKERLGVSFGRLPW
ncbi:MAG: hypothetical protein WBA39_29760, partial [Rivularia sp. (in: cyanobacteria)]